MFKTKKNIPVCPLNTVSKQPNKILVPHTTNCFYLNFKFSLSLAPENELNIKQRKTITRSHHSHYTATVSNQRKKVMEKPNNIWQYKNYWKWQPHYQLSSEKQGAKKENDSFLHISKWLFTTQHPASEDKDNTLKKEIRLKKYKTVAARVKQKKNTIFCTVHHKHHFT